MLQQLGVAQVTLLTNNPVKIAALTRAGLEVVEDRRAMAGRRPRTCFISPPSATAPATYIDFDDLAAHLPVQD